MTREEFTAGLPKLTDNPLPIQPPFLFNGMSARVFPLRASLDSLQRVCDGLLNFVPPQAGYFRAPLPYVMMMVLDYGQVAEAVARIGWFAQIEVFFMVPVEWYKLVGDRWVFHDWAVITPYVFVNDEFSVPLGRTVYGFPKVLAKVTKAKTAWIENAVAPVTLARIETEVFPETYTGAQIQSRVFLEIERATISNLRMPFDASSPVMPWTIVSNIAKTFAGFTRDATWLAQAMRISPVNPFADPGVASEMLSRMMPWFAPGGKGFVQNSLNLKQFRRSENPSDFCYQALTNGQMITTAVNGAGLLGEYEIMLGDIGGGHTVRLYDYASLPIVSTLGLEVQRQWKGPKGNISELKPVMPFWLDVDLLYDQGQNIAWRAIDRIWRDASGTPFDPQPADSSAQAPAFNSTVTTAIDDIAGPFEFSDTAIRVLPLLAKKSALQKYVDGYLNDALLGPITNEHGGAEFLRFCVWSRPAPADITAGEEYAYVYLVVSSFGGVMSLTNNVGDWTKYQLTFMIPAEFQRKNADGDWQMNSVGMVPAFSFVDNCISAIARLEVQGFGATVANFLRPESVWLSDEKEFSSNPEQTLLSVETEVWPALGEGQKASILPVIEIVQGDPKAGLDDAPDAPWRWSELLRAELLAKKETKAQSPNDLRIARALALELLGNQQPFTAYSLKQFRDATNPEKACYQSLVTVPREIKELFDLQEIEETLVVEIHQYPGLDIAGQLGLVATTLPVSDSGIVNSVQAVRPFFIRGTLYEPLAQRLAWRAGTMDWSLDTKTAFSTKLSDQEGSPAITADYRAETLQDQMDPCRMSAIMYQAAQRLNWTEEERKQRNAPAFSKADARRALGNIDPQTVVESVLSREWGNIDSAAKWRAGRKELIKAFGALPLGGPASAFTESVLYRKINNELAEAPGAVSSPLHVEEQYYQNVEELTAQIRQLAKENPETASARWRNTIETIILSQEIFTRLRLEMEENVTLLASLAILKMPGLRAFNQKMGEPPPSVEDLAELGVRLIVGLHTISHQKIEGEPSEYNNLDAQVHADQARLEELLRRLPIGSTVKQVKKWLETHSTEEAMTWALDHTEEFRQMVTLARAYCDAQENAFLNKLSRAYQKPDFCIRRDTVGAASNQLLPLSLSWNADWYYGREIEYHRKLARLKLSNAQSAPATPASVAPAPAKGDSVAQSVGKGADL
ncbi:MAG: hypothetical protein ACRD3N_11480 [Terracidiphilus sp.]